MLLQLALGAALLALPQDSVRVQASLSAPRVAAGSTTVLLISVETGGVAPDQIPVPVLPPGLDLGPVSDFSQLQVSFPGGRTRVTRREIALLAREPGQYRIPPVSIRVGGRTYATSPLTLQVVGSAPGAGGDTSGAVRLRAWLEPDAVFVGQQVLYQVEALLPEELRMRQSRAPDFLPPATTGLWVYDLPDAVTVGLRIIGGATFEVQNFRQVLFPLAAGTVTLPPARMRYEVRQGFAFTPDRREVISPPVTLEVRPLPEGAPREFGGAVGSYTVSAELSSAAVAAGEPVTFQLRVEGAGNVKGLPRPELAEVAGAEVFTGAERTEVGFANGRVSGRKVLEWTLVPRARGRITVPPVQYAWFDPELGQYRRAETASLPLEVLPARRGSSADTSLAPLRGEPAPARLRWTRSPWFAALQLLPPLLLAALWLGRRPRRRGAAGGAASAALLRASTLGHDPRACLDALAEYLRGQDGEDARRLLAQVRAARYAPEEPRPADCERLLAAAHALAAPGRAGKGRTLHAAGAPLLALLLAAGALQTARSEPAAFERGVSAYGAGQHEQAVRAWLEHVRAHPEDAAGWYNLGNAWDRQGASGRAVWAWLRALELEPRDGWARANLRFSGATHALEDFSPRVPLATGEALLLAALLWWAAWLALGLSWFGGRRRARWAALAAFLAIVPLLALVTARGAGGHRAVSIDALALRNAPAARAETIAEIEPGEPLVVIRSRGEWVLARSYDLREGWVERSALARL